MFNKIFTPKDQDQMNPGTFIRKLKTRQLGFDQDFVNLRNRK